jgi:polyhydroxyalkanoate synthesis regulator phasin
MIMANNYYRFWLLNHQGLYIFDKKLHKKVILTKAEEDDLIAEVFQDPRLMSADDTPLFTKELPSYFTRLHYRKYKKDLYILLSDELIDITEVEARLKPWIELRNQQRSHLQGLIISIFDDIEGPKVVYNNGSLLTENALLLAVQGQTISAMGRIVEYTSGFKDPLNVPNREDLIHLSYIFLQPAPDSKDPRIAKMGRMTSIHLLFLLGFHFVNESLFRSYLEAFLDEWVYNWNAQRYNTIAYPREIFDELLEDLRSAISTAIDLTTHEEREEAKLKEYVMDLLSQNKVLNYQVRRLREKIKDLENQLASRLNQL